MELQLYQGFIASGLHAPQLRVEVLLGNARGDNVQFTLAPKSAPSQEGSTLASAPSISAGPRRCPVRGGGAVASCRRCFRSWTTRTTCGWARRPGCCMEKQPGPFRRAGKRSKPRPAFITVPTDAHREFIVASPVRVSAQRSALPRARAVSLLLRQPGSARSWSRPSIPAPARMSLNSVCMVGSRYRRPTRRIAVGDGRGYLIHCWLDR
jgi:hypothetical protein